MVWLIAGLPASAVVAGIVTVTIAGRDPDSLVKQGFVKQGMAVGQDLSPGRRAARFGLSARLALAGRDLRLRLEGSPPAPPAGLRLTLAHPTRAAGDVVLELVRSDGAWHAALPALGGGRRQLILEPPDQGWRLTGAWSAPFTGEVRLAPEPISPHPPR